MDEKKMALGELVGWLDDNDVPYGIDDAGELTVKGDLRDDFRQWVKTCRYTNLPDELVRVDGTLWLERTSIVSLGGLTSVGRSLDLRETPLASLGNLTSVQGYLALQGTSIASLGNLTSVGEWLYLQDTPLTSLGNLTSVGGDFYPECAHLTSLGNLTSVGGALHLRNAPIASLGNLTSVGLWLYLSGTSVTSLDDLPQVGVDLYLDRGQLQLLTRETLKKVKKEIVCYEPFKDEQVTLSPDELETIVAENERRESLNSVRGSDVDWDLYDR